jgi:hypothetical protein
MFTEAAGALEKCKNQEWPFAGVSGSALHIRHFFIFIGNQRFFSVKSQKIFWPRRGGSRWRGAYRPGRNKCSTIGAL